MSSYHVWIVSDPMDNSLANQLIDAWPTIKQSKSTFFNFLSAEAKESELLLNSLFTVQKLYDPNLGGIKAYADRESAHRDLNHNQSLAGTTSILALCSVTPNPTRLPKYTKGEVTDQAQYATPDTMLFEAVLGEIKVIQPEKVSILPITPVLLLPLFVARSNSSGAPNLEPHTP